MVNNLQGRIYQEEEMEESWRGFAILILSNELQEQENIWPKFDIKMKYPIYYCDIFFLMLMEAFIHFPVVKGLTFCQSN